MGGGHACRSEGLIGVPSSTEHVPSVLSVPKTFFWLHIEVLAKTHGTEGFFNDSSHVS